MPMESPYRWAIIQLAEDSAQQTPSKVVDDTTAQCRVGKCGCLSKFVTAGESHGVCDGQNESDDYERSVFQLPMATRSRSKRVLTNQTEPNHTDQSHDSEDSQAHPESWGHIQAQPEESLVCGCHSADIWIG